MASNPEPGCVVIVAPDTYDCYADDSWCAIVTRQIQAHLAASGLLFIWSDSPSLLRAGRLGESVPGCVYAGVLYRAFAVDTETMHPLAGVGARTHGQVLELLAFTRGDACAGTHQRLVWDRHVFANCRGEVFVPQDLIRAASCAGISSLDANDIFAPVGLATDRQPSILTNLAFVGSDAWHVPTASVHGLLARQLGDIQDITVLCSATSAKSSVKSTLAWQYVLLPDGDDVAQLDSDARSAVRVVRDHAVRSEVATMDILGLQ